MDVDFNDAIEERDLHFIQMALARKYRLIVAKPVVVISNCNMEVSALLWDADTKHTDGILKVTTGSASKTVYMQGTVEGTVGSKTSKYTASVPVTNAEEVQVVFSVETTNQYGQTDSSRYFPWRGALDAVKGSDQPQPLFARAVKDSECVAKTETKKEAKKETETEGEIKKKQPDLKKLDDKLGDESNSAANKQGGSSGALLAVAVVLGLLMAAAIVVAVLYVMGLFCFARKYELLVIVPRGSSVHEGHSLDDHGRLRVSISHKATVDALTADIMDAIRDLPVSCKEKKNHKYPFTIRQVTFNGKGAMSVVPVDGHGFATLPFDQTLDDLHIHTHSILELVGLTHVLFIVPPNCEVKQHRSIDDHNRISLVTSPAMDVAMLKDHIRDAIDGEPKEFDIAIWPGDDKPESEARKLPGRGSSLQELEVGNATTVMMIKENPDVQVLKEGYTEEL